LNELIDKILTKIGNLPDPGNLTKVIEKIRESNNRLGFEETKRLLITNFLNLQPAKKGVIIDHVKLRSATPCSICGTSVNNGYFKILLISLANSSPKELIDNQKKVIMSYEVFHNMEKHKIYEKINGATNESFGELYHENSQKNPRDQLSEQELHEQIKRFALEELNEILDRMMNL
jgi:hypothetical protein